MSTIETRWHCGTTHTVNGLNAYKLLTAVEGSATALIAGGNPLNSGIWKSNVIIRASGGSEITLGTGVAMVQRTSYGSSPAVDGGIQSANWSCPATEIVSTDAIKIVEIVTIQADIFPVYANFITNQVSAWAGSDKGQLDAATWTFDRWTYMGTLGCDIATELVWAATYATKINNFTYGAAAGATTYTQSLGIDAYIQKTLTKTLSINAYLAKGNTKTLSSDAILEYIANRITYIDAYLQQLGITNDLNLDAYLKSGYDITSNIDAYLQRLAITNTASIDSILQLIGEIAVGIDSYIQKTGNILTPSIDGILEGATTIFVALNAYLIAAKLKTTSFDSLIEQIKSQVASIDAVLKVTNTPSTNLDALVLYLATKTITIDAYIQVLNNTNTLSVDAILGISGVLKTLSTDALIQKSLTDTLEIDGVLKSLMVKSLSIDAILSEGGSRGRKLKSPLQQLE